MNPEDLEYMLSEENYLQSITRVLNSLYFYSAFVIDEQHSNAFVDRIIYLSNKYERITSERFEFNTESRCIYD